MKPITRKAIVKDHFYILIFWIPFLLIIHLIILGIEYANLKDRQVIDFTKDMQVFLYASIFYFIIWLASFLWRIIFFPTGEDKLFNQIANSNWVKELSLIGFIDIHKSFLIISHVFEFRGIYENIVITFYNSNGGKEIGSIEIYVVLDVDTKIIGETHEWSYMHRDFRLEYEHQDIILSETKLSRTLDIKDAFDDKKMWETIQLFVKIMNETIYNDRKLLDYATIITLKKK